MSATILTLALLAGLLAVSASADGVSPAAWAARRADMVETLRRYGIADPRVLRAMQLVPRHLYIPAPYRTLHAAYADHPVPIGLDQTISQPCIVAYMTEALDIQPGDRVLEIGTGSSYQAAVLAELGADVYSVEILPELADHARAVLAATGYGNRVHVLTGDGYRGWPEHAPFDAIIVTCAPPSIPDALVEQLADGGRLIAPVGLQAQRLVRLRRRGDTIEREDDLPVRFVPMVSSPGIEPASSESVNKEQEEETP